MLLRIAAHRALRDHLAHANWLSAERARAWCRVLAILTAIVMLGYLGTAHDGMDRFGQPLGTDFANFWIAGTEARDGNAEGAYTPPVHEAAMRARFPTASPGLLPFLHPPPFLLLCLGFAALPYLAALAIWLGASFWALYASLRRLLPARWAVLPILVFPAVLVNAGHGQTGLLTAACLGWSMVLARRRPFLAGACLGLLVIKPHLLLAAPIALLAARRWAVIAGAITTACGLCLLSWFVVGEAAWRGFLDAAPFARLILEQSLLEPWKMSSVFAAVRLAHGGVGLAYAVQAGVALAACCWLGAVAWRRPGGLPEGAVLVAALPLCSPYLMDYDLACLAVPIAWVAAEASRTGWRDWEKIVLLAAYALPMAARPVAMSTGLAIGPPILAALLLIVARRAASG